MKTVVPDDGKGMNMEIHNIEDETKFVVKNMIQLSLSCDHRVMDGVMGANFINTVKKQELDWIELIFRYLENPTLLMLQKP